MRSSFSSRPLGVLTILLTAASLGAVLTGPGCSRSPARQAANGGGSADAAVETAEADPSSDRTDARSAGPATVDHAAGGAGEAAGAEEMPEPTVTASATKPASKLMEVRDRLAQPAAPAAEALPLDAPPVPEPPAPDDGEGRGPGAGGDKFDQIVENEFKEVGADPLSTFSIDVDTASYSKLRSTLLDYNRLPTSGAVRIEELVNYFPYDYLAPMGDQPFAAPYGSRGVSWQPEHRLARIAIKGREIEQDNRPVSNLVFLLDVSGSMNRPNKLPLMVQGMKMLVDQLGENDTVSIVVYAGAAGQVLPPTTGQEKATIMAALDKLRAGGSTNGGQGIKLAYQMALKNFVEGGVNRVILCTDGDFNVGVTSPDALIELAAEKAKQNIYLTIIGFGTGNLNDSMMEQLSGKANGNYAFIDSRREAQKVLIEQMSGTLVTIAKDVKIQIEFNPAKVKAYRLIGYENRVLAAEDFNDDKKDAGEIGAGHTVTALYELVPAGAETELQTGRVDELKYQQDRNSPKPPKPRNC